MRQLSNGKQQSEQAAQALVQHEPDRTPAIPDALVQKFAKAHIAFERTFCKALQYAKEAGEILLKLQSQTGLKGVALFAYVREQARLEVSDRSFYLYQRIASRWNELQVVAGNELSEMSLTQAVKLLQGPKEDKPAKRKDKPTPTNSQPEQESGPDAALNTDTHNPAEGETDAKPQEVQEAEMEKAINVQPPFDQPEKDRLAAVYSQNGPAPTPIQLMTNLVIPSLKKVAEVVVGDNDVPFLADAIKEALALIETLKQKYAIS